MYLGEARDVFPKFRLNIHWFYGGKIESYAGGLVLNPRPLNRYVGADPYGNTTAEVFHCPSDRGQDPPPLPKVRTSYDYYGNSYPTNGVFFATPRDPHNVDDPAIPPVRLTDVHVPFPRMVLVGDHQCMYPGLITLRAAWHDHEGLSMNLGFLDGHAAFLKIDLKHTQTDAYSFPLVPLDPNDPENSWYPNL